MADNIDILNDDLATLGMKPSGGGLEEFNALWARNMAGNIGYAISRPDLVGKTSSFMRGSRYADLTHTTYFPVFLPECGSTMHWSIENMVTPDWSTGDDQTGSSTATLWLDTTFLAGHTLGAAAPTSTTYQKTDFDSSAITKSSLIWGTVVHIVRGTETGAPAHGDWADGYVSVSVWTTRETL